MPTKQRDPARERFWRRTIAEQKASGRTVRDFCRDRQLAETAFHHWRRELRERDAAPPPPTRGAAPAFLPLALVPEPGVAAALEVRCPSGHVVNLTGVNAATLRQLFAALAGEGAPC